MADSTVYMQQLIHDLIDLSRVGRSGVEPIDVDLRRLVGAIAEDAGAANPQMEFQVGRLPVVTGDPVGLRQLFTNLLENAVRHAGRPDLVVVVDGRERPDGGVELSVRDNGQGIPAEHRERVFGVFERLEGPRPATGPGADGRPRGARPPARRRAHPGPAGGGADLLRAPGGPRGGAAPGGDPVR